MSWKNEKETKEEQKLEARKKAQRKIDGKATK
jgi:hypothetical protein